MDGEKKNVPLVCFCHCVPEAVIREAIRAGARTIEKIQAETQASTGCGGCHDEVQAILADELEKLKISESKAG